jgi:hypothetical protein
MYTTIITAEIARQHQAQMRQHAARWTLASLFRRPPQPETRPAPRFGGVTAIPSVPSPQTAGSTSTEAAHEQAAHAA